MSEPARKSSDRDTETRRVVEGLGAQRLGKLTEQAIAILRARAAYSRSRRTGEEKP